MKSRKLVTVVCMLAAVLLVAAGCSKGVTPPEPETSEAGAPATSVATPSERGESSSTIDVTLADMSITLSTDTAEAGEVTFDIQNNGAVAHEFVVLRTDDAPDALPTNSDGTANEEAEGITNAGEVEDVQPGASATLTLTLEPGSYALICNLPGHYMAGMHTGLTVG